MPSESKRAHIIVQGRVQGVFYRAYTEKKAKSLNLIGFVKNLYNGNVEIVVEGSESTIHELINWCYQGSPMSNVSNVETHWYKVEDNFSYFTVKY